MFNALKNSKKLANVSVVVDNEDLVIYTLNRLTYD